MEKKREVRLLLTLFIILDFFIIMVLVLVVAGKVRIEVVRKSPEPPPEHRAQASEMKQESQPEAEVLSAEVVDCLEVPRSNLMVAITFGQSNAANCCGSPKEGGPGVYSFSEGRCFYGNDPLPGASGTGGSIWTRLGADLVKRDYYGSVLFAPLGVGATSISAWTPGSPLHTRLIDTIRQLRQAGFEATHLFWVQGERDGLLQMDRDDYKKSFLEMLNGIRAEGVAAPIYVSLTSRRADFVGVEIHRAQKELANAALGILPGPNTDVLGKEYRDGGGIHFSDAGVERIVEMYVACLGGKSADCQPAFGW